MSKWREISFPVDSSRTPELVINDDRAAVVADPLRWQILEGLGGGESLAEISERVGVTDARVLYHLSRLVDAEAVIEEGKRDDPRGQRYRAAAAKIRVREPDGRVEDDRSLEGLLHSDDPEAIPIEVSNDFNQAFREVTEGLFGPTPRILSHNRSRLSEAQAAEFTHRLIELVNEYFPPGKGDRTGIKYGFYGVFTPIDLHPLSDTLDA